VDGASYCRACGANISLVPQALSGELPVAAPQPWPDRYYRKRHQREPRIEEAFRAIFMGIAFTVISILVSKYAPSGATWWFWLLIPACGMFAKGFAELARLRATKDRRSAAQPQVNSVPQQDLPASRTGELKPPAPSVTEGTTRHLGIELKSPPFEFSDTQKPS